MSETHLDSGKLEQIGLWSHSRARIGSYALLMKPRVMSLVVFTGVVGLVMAPGTIEASTGMIAILCIALGAGAAGAINMWYDRDIDLLMDRTKKRPLPAGDVHPLEALLLGIVVSFAAVVVMFWQVNQFASLLLATTILYYVIIYTIWLKRRTPQNIVIGGASGAFPPMIGWAAVTGGLDWGSVVLFLIIFMWTPPHFWSLALFRSEDYERVNVPMMPVVAGKKETKNQILIYTIALLPVSLAPYFIGMSSTIYGVVALLLGFQFIIHAVKVWVDEAVISARPMFLFSIKYLFLIFLGLLIDKAVTAYF